MKLLPSQKIRELVQNGHIQASSPIAEDQIQPASLDLRLSDTAYEVSASFLSGPQATIADRIEALCIRKIDITKPALFERGHIYIIPLMECICKYDIYDYKANPKSSIGRIDVFTRLLIDNNPFFDYIPHSYTGNLYIEVSPRSFNIIVKEGQRLNQLRFCLFDKQGQLEDVDFEELQVNLEGSQEGIIGYRAKRFTNNIDLERINYYNPDDFWEALYANHSKSLLLNPNDFYILSSNQLISIPPIQAAELRPYNSYLGEFRAHYAGFFDPGFGYVYNNTTKAVFEIRCFDTPFMLYHNQLIASLVYERMSEVPDKLYNSAIGSSYQNQGLRLSKYFKQP